VKFKGAGSQSGVAPVVALVLKVFFPSDFSVMKIAADRPPQPSSERLRGAFSAGFGLSASCGLSVR